MSDDWVCELFNRLLSQDRIMPWPEAPQEVAFLGFYIDRLREDLEVTRLNLESATAGAESFRLQRDRARAKLKVADPTEGV